VTSFLHCVFASLDVDAIQYRPVYAWWACFDHDFSISTANRE